MRGLWNWRFFGGFSLSLSRYPPRILQEQTNPKRRRTYLACWRLQYFFINTRTGSYMVFKSVFDSPHHSFGSPLALLIWTLSFLSLSLSFTPSRSLSVYMCSVNIRKNWTMFCFSSPIPPIFFLCALDDIPSTRCYPFLPRPPPPATFILCFFCLWLFLFLSFPPLDSTTSSLPPAQHSHYLQA